MARIRTVKPELFRHEGLYELEAETGLPVRLAFAGLFTASDRGGYFKWRPRELKLDVMPYDLIDFSRVMDALGTRGFLVRYRVGDEWFGLIPTFTKHQVINNRERVSDLPQIEDAEEIYDFSPNENKDLLTRDLRVNDASATREGNVQGEGKGREGKGTGKGTTRDSSFDQFFEKFWKLYPNKVGKPKAMAKLKLINPDGKLDEAIMEGLARHCVSQGWLKDNGEFIPHPTTWLNRQGWEDEVKPHVATTNGQRTGSGRLSAVDQVRAENDAAEARRRAARSEAEVTGHLQESPPIDGDWDREFASIRDIDGKIVGDDGGALRAQVDIFLRDE